MSKEIQQADRENMRYQPPYHGNSRVGFQTTDEKLRVCACAYRQASTPTHSSTRPSNQGRCGVMLLVTNDGVGVLIMCWKAKPLNPLCPLNVKILWGRKTSHRFPPNSIVACCGLSVVGDVFSHRRTNGQILFSTMVGCLSTQCCTLHWDYERED